MLSYAEKVITMEKKRKGLSLSQRTTLLVAVCIVLLIVLSEVFSNQVIGKLMQSQSRELLQEKSRINAQVINEWLDKQGMMIDSMASALEAEDDLDHTKIMEYLANQLPLNENALMYYACFAYDKSVCAADYSTVDLDPTTRIWWTQAMEKKGVIYTQPYVDAVTETMVISVATPIKIQGEDCVVLADIKIDEILDRMDSIITDTSTKVFLLTSNNEVIVHSNEAFMPTAENTTVLTDEVKLDVAASEVTTFTDYDGKTRFASVYTVESTGWKIGVTMDLDVLQALISGNQKTNMGVILAIMSIFLIVISLVLKKMLSPVSHSIITLTKIAEGDFEVQTKETNRSDEVGVLQNTVVLLEKRLKEIVNGTNHVLGEISSYNLVVDDMKSYPGEFNKLAKSVNTIKNILRNLLADVQEAANSVGIGAEQFAQASDSLSQGTTQQAASIARIEEEMDDVNDRITRNAKNCGLIGTELSDLENHISEGNGKMQELLIAVEDVEKMSNDILAIVKVIDNIAFQTNILALNASVEAARAGDSGMGFAVVAEEVRNLAGKCTEESQKTNELIEGCIEAIKKAKQSADNTSLRLEKVVTSSDHIFEAFSTIQKDTEEQAGKSREIMDEIHIISDVIQSATAAAEQTAASSMELSGHAQEMTNSINHFRVR